MSKAPFEYTDGICIELSNICNKMCHSPRCPLAFYKKVGGAGKVVLPSYIVKRTIDELAENGYEGYICYSIYNEPVMDPRLIYFMHYAKEKLGFNSAFVITNGSTSNQQTIDELVEAGLQTLWVSCYSDEVHKEFSSYTYPDDVNAILLRYYELLVIDDTYNRDYIDSSEPCFAPLKQIVVRCNGTIHLCCRDYATSHQFGVLDKDTTLMDILQKGEMHALREELVKGNRTLDVCRRCNTSF